MFFGARIYSKEYVHIIPGKLRNNELNSNKKNENRILKKFKKDKKLIYAFFLDIAQIVQKFLFSDQKKNNILEKIYNSIVLWKQ